VNGLTALATYLHIHRGYDTLYIIKSLWAVLAILSTLAALVSVKRRDPFVSTFSWYIAFLAGFWGDNPQFLVILVALGVAALAGLKGRLEKALSLSLVLWASLWASFYPVDFWFHVHMERVNRTMESLARALVLYVPSDLGYTVYFVTLFILEIATLIVIFLGSSSKDSLGV